jgi:hypothetical protein
MDWLDEIVKRCFQKDANTRGSAEELRQISFYIIVFVIFYL